MNKYYVILSIQLMLIAGSTVPEKPQKLAKSIFTNTSRPEASEKKRCELAENVEKSIKKNMRDNQASLSKEIENECLSSPAYKRLKELLPEETVAKVKNNCVQKMQTYMHNTVPKCIANCCITTPQSNPISRFNQCANSCEKERAKEMYKFWAKALKEEGVSLPQQPGLASVLIYSPQQPRPASCLWIYSMHLLQP